MWHLDDPCSQNGGQRLKHPTGSKPTSNLSNFEAQFKRSTILLLVLRLLSEREMYAYEMIQETLRRSGGVYKMPLLYTVLNKLKGLGSIEGNLPFLHLLAVDIYVDHGIGRTI